MANNLSIEAPNFDKIEKETGQYTSTAMSTLWAALNDTRKVERLHYLYSQTEQYVEELAVNAAASVDNLLVSGYGMVYFTGTTAQNFTGMVAPETGRVKIMMVKVTGSGTITMKHNLTSLAANRFILSGAADYSMTTGKGGVFAYLLSNWYDIARL